MVPVLPELPYLPSKAGKMEINTVFDIDNKVPTNIGKVLIFLYNLY